MRILLTSDAYKPAISGVVTSLVNLQQGLTQLGHEVRVLTLGESHRTYYKDGVWYLSSLSSGKIYPGTRVRNTLAWKPVKDLINWRPDVVHSQCEFSTFPLAKHIAHAVKAPLVHTYHTLYEDYTTYFSPNEKMGKVMAQHFSHRILAKTDAVIVPTSKIDRLLRSYGVLRPIKVIPSGIDLSRFAPTTEKKVLDALRADLGIPENNQVIVYVGRLAEEKNLNELIANFPANRIDLTLLLVGDGPQKQQLKQQVVDLGLQKQVVFAGMQDPKDIAFFYQLGSVFCSASTSETQGMTYIEALASALPVLCRADDCLDDLVEDGVNGWQYHTSEEFHHYLNLLCSDAMLRKKISDQALLSSARYDRIIFAESVCAVYRDLIEKRLKK